MSDLKGLTAYVYSNPLTRKCAMDGASARCDSITVVGLGKDSEIFEVTPKCPAFRLERGPYNSIRLVPVDQPKGKVGPMMGGSYAGTSDGRFSAACERLLGHPFYGAVAIHDRFETSEQNEMLSR